MTYPTRPVKHWPRRRRLALPLPAPTAADEESARLGPGLRARFPVAAARIAAAARRRGVRRVVAVAITLAALAVALWR